MKLKERIWKFRRVLALLIILSSTILLEAGFNNRAIRYGYSDLDITQNMTIKDKTDDEGNPYQKCVITYKPEKSIYVKDLVIAGTFTDKANLKMEITSVNSFGKKVTTEETDKLTSWISEHHTNLNRRISEIEIRFKLPAGSTLTSVTFNNNVEINRYRIAFFLIVFTLLYLAFFEEFFRKRPEFYFAAFALSIGIFLIFCTQSVCHSWDEQIHFGIVYNLASGDTVNWTDAAVNTSGRTTPNYNSNEEYAQLHDAMKVRGKTTLYTAEATPVSIRTHITYLPMTIAMKIAMLFNTSFWTMYIFGKLGNLLFYTILMSLAIHFAEHKKLLLLFLALAPTNIFLACSYSYDGVIFSTVTLGCVLLFQEIYGEHQRQNAKDWIPAGIGIVLIAIGSLAKYVYIPLIGMVLLIPQFKRLKTWKKILLYSIAICIALSVVFFIIIPVAMNYLNTGATMTGDTRGGETDFVLQAVSMLKHPLASIKLLLSNIFSLEHFRNRGFEETDHFFFGNLMFLNLSLYGTLADKWATLLIATLVILLFYQSKKELTTRNIAWKERTWIGILIFVAVVLIWLALYLAFTPIGQDYIEGVQTRYYLPLFYIFAQLFTTRKTYFQISETAITRFTFVFLNIFWIAELFGLVLKPTLF